MFIEIRKTRNTDDSLGSGTKLLLPSWLLGIRHEERDTQFLLCWLIHLTRQRAAHPLDHNWTGLTQVQKSIRFVPVQISTRFVQLQISTPCFYSKSLRIPAHRFRALRHSHSQSYFFFGVFIVTSVIVTSSSRAWTHALMSAPTHAHSRKVLSLTKPKDQIYKTKNDNIKNSFRNHTTTGILDKCNN